MTIDRLRHLALARIAAVAAVACLAATTALAATVAATSPAASASAPRCPDGRDLSRVRVDAVSRADAAATPATTPPVVALRDEIAVHVSGLQTLIERQRCATTQRRIVLFLDGRPVPTAVPYPPVDPADEELRFVLTRDEESREIWTHLLGRPTFAKRRVPVSVGIADEYAVASDASIDLLVIPKGWFWTWTALLVLLMAAFLALAMKSDVLRDNGSTPIGGRKPYSLAKVQAAWWFFLILTSYLLIGLVTGDYNTSITGTVLSLMGISAATAVGSAVIDVGKDNPADDGTARVAGTRTATPKPAPATRGRWWLDILSDANGVNFHRFQMASWTAVLGVIFIHGVYISLAMPEFSNALLGLLGISSGTYLGLKTTSEKTPKPG